MISAKFHWGNVFFGGKLQIDEQNSNFENFESILYLKSVSMPLIWGTKKGENNRDDRQVTKAMLLPYTYSVITE